MFRLLLSIVYLVVTVLGAVVVYMAVDDAAEPIEQNLKRRVFLSHKGYTASKKLRDLQLTGLAKELADSELEIYLAVLEDNRNRMLKLEAEVYDIIPGEVDDPDLMAKRQEFVKGKEEFLTSFSETLARRLEIIRGDGAWMEETREKYVLAVRERLIECNARAVSDCFYKFTFDPLERLVKDGRRKGSYATLVDMVILVDDRGTGLANADRKRWSNDTRFSETYPLVRESRKGNVTLDVIQKKSSFFFAAAAPIIDREDGVYRGSVVVGIEIDDDFLRREADTVGWNVSYVKGKDLLRTLLLEKSKAEMMANLPGRGAAAQSTGLETESLVMQYVPVKGNYSAHDVGVILTGDRQAAMQPIRSIAAYIPVYGFMMFLFGIILVGWVIRTYMKPLVEIDTGIHEIMAGDHDYEFKADYNDKLWDAMAQSLNRMVGILLGRELEDEDLEAYLGVKTRPKKDEAAGT